MKVHIAIDTKTFVRFWLVVIGFALFFYALFLAKTALIIIGVSLFLALALNGPVARLTKLLPGESRALSTAISYVVVLLFLGGFFYLVIPPIVDQSVKFANNLPEYSKTVTTQWHRVHEFVEKYHLAGQVDHVVVSIKNETSKFADGVSTSLLNNLGSVAGLFTSSLLVLVLTFLMLVEGPEWMRRLWSVYRDEDTMKHHRSVLDKMYAVVNGYVTGQLTVSALDGLFAGIFVFILSFIFDIPGNLALPAAAILFIASMIPMFGATIGGAIITVLLGLNSIPAAIVFVIYFIIYQQIENNFISPTVQAKRLDLSPLAILAAVTIGLYVFGIAGGIISIPIAGCIKVLVEDYLERANKARKQSEKPLAKLAKKLQGADD